MQSFWKPRPTAILRKQTHVFTCLTTKHKNKKQKNKNLFSLFYLKGGLESRVPHYFLKKTLNVPLARSSNFKKWAMGDGILIYFLVLSGDF